MCFAKRNVSLCSFLVEGTTTKFTFDHSSLLSFIDNSFFLLSHLTTFSIDFESSSESNGLSFPFGHILFFLLKVFLLFDFFLDDFSLFHKFLLFFGDDSLLLNIELRSFILEDFFAYFFVFYNTIRIEFSTTTLSTHDKCWWVILFDLLFSIWIFWLIIIRRWLLICIFRLSGFSESIFGWYSWVRIWVLLRFRLIDFRLCFRELLLLVSSFLLSLIINSILFSLIICSVLFSLVVIFILVVITVTTSIHILITASICIWLLLIVRIRVLVVWILVLVCFVIGVSWFHFTHCILVVVYKLNIKYNQSFLLRTVRGLVQYCIHFHLFIAYCGSIYEFMMYHSFDCNRMCFNIAVHILMVFSLC